MQARPKESSVDGVQLASGADTIGAVTARTTIVALASLALAVGAAAGGTHVAPAPTPRTGAVPWPAPSDPLRRTRLAGLSPERHEFLRYHVHAHLDIFLNGRPVTVPAGIGINIHDPGVQSGKLPDGSMGYGGIDLCAQPCISPLHTHDDTGVLHTESKHNVPNRLGQFFTEWGVALSTRCVGGYCEPKAALAFSVDGKAYHGDPRAITLTNLKEIAIVIGTPPKQIPTHFPTG
jgi:hypothetical protein